jgi:hypothetical protein
MGGARLVKILLRAAGLVPVSKSVSISHLSAGVFSASERHPAPKNIVNLMRCEIFRGKILRAKLKN